VKPHKSYKSLYKGRRRLEKLLFLCVVIQLILLFLLNATIPIPSGFAGSLLQQLEDDGLSIELEGIEFNFPNQLLIRKIEVSKDDAPVIELNGLELRLSIFDLLWQDIDSIDELRVDGILFHSPVKGPGTLVLGELNSGKDSNGHRHFKGTLSMKRSVLEVIGSADLEYLKSLSRPSTGPRPPFSPTKSIESLIASIDFLANVLEGSRPIHLQAFLSLSPNGRIMVSQSQTAYHEKEEGFSGEIRGACSFLELSSPEERSAFFKSKVMGLRMATKSVDLNFHDLSLEMPSISLATLADLPESIGESSFKVGKIEFGNRVQGNLPPFNLHAKSWEGFMKGIFLSDSNRSRIAIAYELNSTLSLEGEAHIFPELYDLTCDTKKGRLRILRGDECKLQINKNTAGIDDSHPMSFRVTSNRLSVMETPEGAYALEGMIAPDFSILVDSAWCKLGKSEVKGSYHQSWFPHNYRFLLRGTCLPTDINNWLGSWWKSIWTDFVFSDEIPHGDFSIAGNWLKPNVGNQTFGAIRTKKFSYRDFLVSSSRVKVSVDDHQTKVDAIADHEEGRLEGDLSIPRQGRRSDELLSFSLAGRYPLDKGRKVFGQEVESHLSDFNATLVSGEARGTIIKGGLERSGDNNGTFFSIKLSSDGNASFWSIPVNDFYGEIQYGNSTTEGSFPAIGLAKGKASLTFKSKSFSDNQSLDFKFNLEHADRSSMASALSNLSLIDPKDKERIETMAGVKDEAGRVDLSVQAIGPSGDLLQFKGSGRLRLHEKGLSQVNVLGGISKTLNASKLPIPSGSFSFEKLDIPFQIENEQIYSDHILLTGPLSSLQAKGSLNLISEELDLTAKLKLAGNLKIPLIGGIINLADPLSKITEIKITGNWRDPETQLIVNPFK